LQRELRAVTKGPDCGPTSPEIQGTPRVGPARFLPRSVNSTALHISYTSDWQITRYDEALRDGTQLQLQDCRIHRPHLARRGGDYRMGSARTEGTREDVRVHRIP